MPMQGYLRRLSNVVVGWILVLWIYLSVGWRFCGWRLQLWYRQAYMVENTHTAKKRTLLLIRHGQTTWNIEHRLPGKLPGVMLTDIGREQVARLADALSALPISAIISSPLERASETAEIIAKRAGQDMGQTAPLLIQFEPDLEDIDLGRWTGQIVDELSKNDPAWKAFVRDPSVAPEGVGTETFPQLQERSLAAINRWLQQDSIGDYPAFVAHADVIKVLIAYYTGLEAGHAGRLFIDNASVSLVELEGEHRPRVIAISWSPQPGWLKPPTPANQQPKTEGQQEGEQKE